MTERAKWALLAGSILVWVGLLAFQMITEPEPQRVPLTYKSGRTLRQGANQPLMLKKALLAQARHLSFDPPKNIFAPLEMKHTAYRDSHTLIVPNRALAYDSKEKEAGYSINVSYFEQTGDGAVHTSVEDLLKWDENFYSGQYSATGEAGKTFAERRHPEILAGDSGLRAQDYDFAPAKSHQRAA